MARRSTRHKLRDRNQEDIGNVHALFPQRGNWNPLDGDLRDRKYVKNIRALIPQQQILIDAIAERAVVVALGPAGTGKTYLAVAKAVDALESGLLHHLFQLVLARMHADRFSEIAVGLGVACHELSEPGQHLERVGVVKRRQGPPNL